MKKRKKRGKNKEDPTLFLPFVPDRENSDIIDTVY